ncbi:MAG: efflux RND transporter periplasmic adaptor subunit [Acidobacteriota bacterium]|nr:efflux RND transporter periplasmic adaptor subunit [Acidobacteriota bacterium]
MKFLTTVLAVCLAGVATGCDQPEAHKQTEQAVPVQAVTVAASGADGVVVVSGVVKPRLESDLAAQIVAPVDAVTVHEGDRVRRGQVLVRLHAPAVLAGVQQADAALHSAEQQRAAATAQAQLAAQNLARYQQLRERRSVTAYELDQVRSQSEASQAQQQSAAAQVTAAQSALAAQRANADDTILKAPFDGVVARRLVDPGAMAAPGAPLLHLQTTGELDVEFQVNASMLSTLRPGSKLKMVAEDGATYTGAVTTLSPAGDASAHAFLVKAAIASSPALHTGDVIQVQLPSAGAAQPLTVPESALVQQGGLDAVLLVAGDGRAGVRYVTLGRHAAGMVEVLSGLHAGDRVLRQGSLELAGREVEVRP